MTRREAACAAGIGVFALLIANAAWLSGLSELPAGARLSGIHSLNSADTPTYFAWIDQARRGEVLFRQLYTSEPHERALFHPLFLAIGVGARAFDVPNEVAFHAARLLLGALLVPLACAFFAGVHPDAARRLASLALLLLAAGLGWVWLLAGEPSLRWPIDLWVPEAFGFLSLVETPLNLAAYCLWALVGALSLRSLEGGGVGVRVALAALVALLVSMRPHAGAAPAVALVAMGGTGVLALRRAPLRAVAATAAPILLGVGLGILPPLHALTSGPAFSGWRGAASGARPSLVAIAAGLAIPLGLAVAGARPLVARGGVAGPWLVGWAVGVLALVFAPVGPSVPFARKMFEALPIPLAALAGEGLVRLAGGRDAPRRTRALRLAAVAGLLLAAAGSGAALLVRDAQSFARGALPQVLPACLREGLAHLAAEGTPEDVVLAPASLGSLVPAFTGHTVVCCHYDQTLEADRKQAEVARFYAQGDAPRAELLAEHRVRHVLYLSGRRPPRELEPLLELELESSCLGLWRVLPAAQTPGS